MTEKISATIQDYLGTIYTLERDGQPVVGAHMADLFGVRPATVSFTFKRMQRNGLITLDAAHTPHLTQEGLAEARSVVRKHMLAELMLARMLSWSDLHKEAHELEHAISNEVEAALLEELNDPEVCPHGNPLPGHESVASAWLPLTAAAVKDSLAGARFIVRRIHEFAEDNHDVLAFLEQKKISPGQEITIKEVLPFNQTLTICVAGELVSLGFALARYIFVEPVVQR